MNDQSLRLSSTAAAMTAFPEIVKVTLRQLLGRRRTILLLLLSALPLVLAILLRAADRVEIQFYTTRAYEAIALTIVLPLTAVLFGTGTFTAEHDEGTIVYLLAKPMPRWLIVLAKSVTAASMTMVLSIISVVAGALVVVLPAPGDGAAATEAYIAGIIVASLCYTGVFVTLSLFTRRALVIGIGYTLIWEGLLSGLLPGIANLSIRQYALGVADAIYRLNETAATLPSQTALILTLIVVVGAFAAGVWKLMRYELPGGD